MRKAYDLFVAALQIVSAALCLAMLGVVVLGVFWRYVLDDALVWYDEFAGYVLVWLTMIGSVLALVRRKHIGFETLVERMPPRARRAAEVFALVCVLGFSLVLVVSGSELIREMGDETAISLPWVKMAWVYSVMPVSGALLALVAAVQIAGTVRGAGGDGPGRAPAPRGEAAR